MSANQAAKRLGIDRATVAVWVKNGRLPGRIEKVTRELVFVPESALQTPYEVRCLWCGKEFKAKHRGLAKYCCKEHKHKYLYRKRKAG